jgi:hypothetical protein
MHRHVERRQPHPRRSTSIATRRRRRPRSSPTALPMRTAGTTSGAIAFSGPDPTSGLQAVAEHRTVGPDNPNASVSGSARTTRETSRPVELRAQVRRDRSTISTFRIARPRKGEARLAMAQDASVRSSSCARPGLKGARRASSSAAEASRRLRRSRACVPAASTSTSLTATDARPTERRRRSASSPRCAARPRPRAAGHEGAAPRLGAQRGPATTTSSSCGAAACSALGPPGAPAAAARLEVPRASLQTAARNVQLVRLARLRPRFLPAGTEDARRQHLRIRRLELRRRRCADTDFCWSLVSARCY